MAGTCYLTLVQRRRQGVRFRDGRAFSLHGNSNKLNPVPVGQLIPAWSIQPIMLLQERAKFLGLDTPQPRLSAGLEKPRNEPCPGTSVRSPVLTRADIGENDPTAGASRRGALIEQRSDSLWSQVHQETFCHYDRRVPDRRSSSRLTAAQRRATKGATTGESVLWDQVFGDLSRCVSSGMPVQGCC